MELWDASLLRAAFPEYFEARRKLFNEPTRGFGYWSWKAFLLRRHLEATDSQQQRILYVDAGSHLNVNPVSTERFREYEHHVDDHGVLLMHMEHLPERAWTKPAVLDYFGLTDEQRTSGQIMATVVMVSRTDLALDLCTQWDEAGLVDQHRLLMEPSSEECKSPHLVAARYDQSVLSCLAKSRDIPTIPDETFFDPRWKELGTNYPIWTVRNRSGVRFSTNPWWFKTKKVVERIHLAARYGET